MALGDLSLPRTSLDSAFHFCTFSPLASRTEWATCARGLLCPSPLNLPTSIPTPVNTLLSRARPTLDLCPCAPAPPGDHQFSFVHTFQRTQYHEHNTTGFPRKSVQVLSSFFHILISSQYLSQQEIFAECMFCAKYCTEPSSQILSFNPHYIPVR